MEEFKKNYIAEVGLYLPGKTDREIPQVFAATIDQPLASGETVSDAFFVQER